MQPGQTPPPAPPPAPPSGGGQSPQYDFIINPGQAAKRPLIPLGQSKKSRIIAAIVGLAVLLALMAIVSTIVNNVSKADTAALVAAAQQQQELIRVADIGIDKAKGQDAKNIAITTKLSLQSQQAEMQNAIKAAGLNPKKVLASGVSAETTGALTTAEQTNHFDEEFLKIMSISLKEYQKSLDEAYNNATSKKLKSALQIQYQNANTLVGEISS